MVPSTPSNSVTPSTATSRPGAAAHGGRRLLELDALRGLAAAAVVLFHFTGRFDQLFGHAGRPLFFAPWGEFGVDLFFMISGFVIFMTLDRAKNASEFVVGRFSRLFPAYWTALAITFAVVSLCGLPGEEVKFGAALANLTMIQGVFKFPHVDGAYWSLQVELFFYAAMLLLHRVGALKGGRVYRTLAVWIVLAAGVRIADILLGGEISLIRSIAGKLQTVLTLRYIHLFAIGMLLYRSRERAAQSGMVGTEARVKWIERALLVACLAEHWLVDGVVGTLIVAGLAILFALAARGNLAILRAAPLVFLGSISYSLYLLHQNLGYVLIRWLNSLGLGANASIAIAIGMAIGLATLMTRFVEQPAMRWIKDRYRRGRLASVRSVARDTGQVLA